jgi:integrase/recombinase XerD
MAPASAAPLASSISWSSRKVGCHFSIAPAFLIRISGGYARRAALFEVLYASGMRVSEAVCLPASSIGPRTRAMTVRGKERFVPLHERAIRAVSWWRRLAMAHGTQSETSLFHAVRNPSSPLSRQAALFEIKEAALAAAVPRPDLAA